MKNAYNYGGFRGYNFFFFCDAMDMSGKHSTTELQPQPECFALIFETGFYYVIQAGLKLA